MNRREFVAAAFGAAAACAAGSSAAPRAGASGCGWKFAINPSTVRGFRLPLMKQARLAAAAGYDGIEPWISDMLAAKKSGGLRDFAKFCADSGLEVVNGIGFAQWASPDAAVRREGMETMKRDMELMLEVGGARIAAPPFGLQKPGSPKVALDDFAERYAAVLDLGAAMGVQPLLEFWGHSANLSRLSEALYVAAAAGRPGAAILADVYHMHRGGSAFSGFGLLNAATLPVLHLNDSPAEPPREKLKDADRVWPGDGTAPWADIFAAFRANSMKPWFSLELFNPSYWTETPEKTLAAGIAKMRALTARFGV